MNRTDLHIHQGLKAAICEIVFGVQRSEHLVVARAESLAELKRELGRVLPSMDAQLISAKLIRDDMLNLHPNLAPLAAQLTDDKACAISGLPRPQAAQNEHRKGTLQTTIMKVEPFTADSFTETSGVVPPNLYPVLFPETGERLQCYALMSSHTVPQLKEILEASGLEHECLFKASALDEYGDIAPWLVALEPEASLTKSLFTTSNGIATPWQLWSASAAIFLVSSNSLPDLARHFRRFIRLPDEEGAFFYIRFWMPEVWELLMAHFVRRPDQADTFFQPRGVQVIARTAVIDAADSLCSILEPVGPLTPSGKAPVSVVLDDTLKAGLRQLVQKTSYRKCRAYLRKRAAQRFPGSPDANNLGAFYHDRAINIGRQAGITSELGVCRLGVAMMDIGPNFIDDPRYISVGLSRKGLAFDTAGDLLVETLNTMSSWRDPELIGKAEDIMSSHDFDLFVSAPMIALRDFDLSGANVWESALGAFCAAAGKPHHNATSHNIARHLLASYIYGIGYESIPDLTLPRWAVEDNVEAL
ncbi:DUF4123 domain-containing protein [Litoreibacter albidus]|uniref:DUF4123 domain-containing protein n=1 Tax=Litoreibacter albidus TaxID=670155 RepID=UPI003735C23C